MKFIGRVLALVVIASAGISCAATPNSGSQPREAVLLNADRAEIREAIRIFIRKDAGNFVIADPDSLTISSKMVVQRRARDYEYQARRLPAANLDYRLLSDGNNCWLVRHETDSTSPVAAKLALPNSAICSFYSTP